MNNLDLSGATKTLRQRLNEGRIPVQDGLRYAALLAEAVREAHDRGNAHGSISPDSITLTATGLDLLPGFPGIGRITTYTAPEVTEGKDADVRSDIFSFGAVVFEALTGRKAFEGESEAALMAALRGAPASPSGSPAVDRLLAGCLAKDPAARWQRIQKVQLELKLLTAAARRVAPAAAPRGGVPDMALRTEFVQMESRFSARLDAVERAVGDLQRASLDAVSSLRAQISSMGSQLAMAGSSPLGRSVDPGPVIEAAVERIEARVQRGVDSLTERVAYLEQRPAGAGGDVSHYEDGLERLRAQLAELHGHVAADMHEFELNLKAQSNAIDSARTAMAQTDDLVERVVEALESLQSTVLEQSEGHAMALN